MGGLGSHQEHSYAVQAIAFALAMLLPAAALLLAAGAAWEERRRRRIVPVKRQVGAGPLLTPKPSLD
jgi:hypothetical protein